MAADSQANGNVHGELMACESQTHGKSMSIAICADRFHCFGLFRFKRRNLLELLAASRFGVQGSVLRLVSLRDTLEAMIRTWRHKGVEDFFATGKKSGIQPHHAAKLGRLLAVLNAAAAPEAMNLPGFGWHPLAGDLAGHWAVSVNGNWRLTYSFEGADAILVDYQDYH